MREREEKEHSLRLSLLFSLFLYSPLPPCLFLSLSFSFSASYPSVSRCSCCHDRVECTFNGCSNGLCESSSSRCEVREERHIRAGSFCKWVFFYRHAGWSILR